MPLLRFLPLLFLAPCIAPAALSWTTTEKSLAPALGAQSAEASFTFTNTGETAVTLSQVSASCGCTVPTLTQRTFAPGEPGEIRAIYNMGERQGLNRSVISVRSDDGVLHTLTLNVDIPVAIQSRPRVLNWRVDEAPAPKTIALTIHPDLDLEVVGISTADETFSVEVEPADEKGHYRVVVTPASTATRHRATFSLEFSEPPARPVQVFAFVF
jgi:hypothetical protein